MRKYVFKRVFSIAMALALVLSMSSVAFAATDTDTATKNGYTLTGSVEYWGRDPLEGWDGDINMTSSWSGSKVRGIYATAEVVDYLTGESLKSISNNASNATFVLATGINQILNTRRVTVYGCGEIRDSFSLATYPTIYGTYGNA